MMFGFRAIQLPRQQPSELLVGCEVESSIGHHSQYTGSISPARIKGFAAATAPCIRLHVGGQKNQSETWLILSLSGLNRK